MSDLRFLIFFKFTFIELFCIQVLSKDIKKGRSLGMIEIKANIGIFSNVLVEAARNLDKLGMHMWDIKKLKPDVLLKEYKIEDMKLCYENNELIGVYILQYGDKLFWSDDNSDFAVIHKLALLPEHKGKGYGRKLMATVDDICKSNNINSIRLNCGTFRTNLRKFYESCGFKAVDRVFIDNRDQMRYRKELLWRM